MKLHLGCGTVYLDGYCNVDIIGHLAVDRPDLVEVNCTTLDNYYKLPVKEAIKAAPTREVVVDFRDDIVHLDTFMSFGYSSQEATEIVAIQALEHFVPEDAKIALETWYLTLKHGGHLLLSVPDFPEVARMYLMAETEEEKDWCLRQIYGSHKDDYAHHYDGYSLAKLTRMLEEAGFTDIEPQRNFHDYPAIVIKATKCAMTT